MFVLPDVPGGLSSHLLRPALLWFTAGAQAAASDACSCRDAAGCSSGVQQVVFTQQGGFTFGFPAQTDEVADIGLSFGAPPPLANPTPLPPSAVCTPSSRGSLAGFPVTVTAAGPQDSQDYLYGKVIGAA